MGRGAFPDADGDVVAFRKRFSPVCGLLPERTPPIGRRPAIDMCVDGDVGASRPPARGRRATRIESEVGNMVGHGKYYSGTQVYITFSLRSGTRTRRWIGYAQGQTKTDRPSTEGRILQDSS